MTISTGSWFGELSESVRQGLFARARNVCCPRGEQVYMAGEPADSVYLLEQGLVRRDVLTVEGRVMAAGLVRPGELFAEAALFGRRHTTFAQVLVDSELIAIPAEDFRRAMQRAPELSSWVADIIGRRILATDALTEALNRRAAPVRMAGLLLSLIEAPLTSVSGLSHQDLGDLIGVYRETATHILNAFRRLGLIAHEPMFVEILCPNALRKVADDKRRRSVLQRISRQARPLSDSEFLQPAGPYS